MLTSIWVNCEVKLDVVGKRGRGICSDSLKRKSKSIQTIKQTIDGDRSAWVRCRASSDSLCLTALSGLIPRNYAVTAYCQSIAQSPCHLILQETVNHTPVFLNYLLLNSHVKLCSTPFRRLWGEVLFSLLHFASAYWHISAFFPPQKSERWMVWSVLECNRIIIWP